MRMLFARPMGTFSLVCLILFSSLPTAKAQEAVDAVQQATINQLKKENEELKSAVIRLDGQMLGMKFQTLYKCPNSCAGNSTVGDIISASSTCSIMGFQGRTSTVQCAAIGQVAYK